MGFEGHGAESWYGKSPGGFEFGVQGWQWGPPVPKSITFFLDNTAVVCDQYGRQIRRAVSDAGVEVRFADAPPEANKDGEVIPRPQFATHGQVIAALAAEGIDWLAYEVRWRTRDGSNKMRGRLSMIDAGKLQLRLLGEGNAPVVMDRTIASAGWPQIPYDELKKLPELPPTPLEELRKIRDSHLRKDAIRIRREVDEAREAELQVAAEE